MGLPIFGLKQPNHRFQNLPDGKHESSLTQPQSKIAPITSHIKSLTNLKFGVVKTQKKIDGNENIKIFRASKQLFDENNYQDNFTENSWPANKSRDKRKSIEKRGQGIQESENDRFNINLITHTNFVTDSNNKNPNTWASSIGQKTKRLVPQSSAYWEKGRQSLSHGKPIHVFQV
jgi:hypothetical protein